MKRILKLIVVFSSVLMAFSPPIQAQSFASASITLKEASHAEMVTGDIDRAISLYRQVAESASASRENVAKALLALGRSYELTGSGEAGSAYNRVVSEFSDQAQAFMSAREALVRLTKSSPELVDAGPIVEQDYTLVMKSLPYRANNNERAYDFSPNGSTVVVSAPPLDSRKQKYPELEKELYFLDVGSTVMKPVLDEPGEWVSQVRPRWSPNGKHILFTGTIRSENGNSGMNARIDLDANTTVRLGNLTGQFSEWMPNSTEFISRFGGGLLRYSMDGTLVEKIEVNWGHQAHTGTVSPDGRFLVFDRVRSDSDIHSELDVWILNLETGEETQLTDDDGFEGSATWSNDGKSIFYAAGSETVQNLYKMTIGSNAPPEKITQYSNARVVFPTILPESGQLTFSLVRENDTIRSASADSPETHSAVIRGRSPMISPDGSTLYYLDVEPGRAGIWTASIDGQNPIQMVSGHIASSYGSQAFLSPDGNHLAYFMYEGLKTTLYTLPVNGGSARKLFTSDHQQGQTPAWSPDSEEIAFVDGKDLFVISAQGGRPESIATSKEWEGWMVEWSPNGRHVAGFGFEEGEENNVLYIVDRDSKERKRVTPPEESGYKEIFNWHPDGDRISYMYYGPDWERDGSQVISIDGGAPKPFAQMPAPMWDYVGVWGPDHRYYFISVGWNNAWGLYSTDEESNEFTTIRQLSDRSVNLPNWSEDGSVIAWSETESSRQLWMLTDYE